MSENQFEEVLLRVNRDNIPFHAEKRDLLRFLAEYGNMHVKRMTTDDIGNAYMPVADERLHSLLQALPSDIVDRTKVRFGDLIAEIKNIAPAAAHDVAQSYVEFRKNGVQPVAEMLLPKSLDTAGAWVKQARIHVPTPRPQEDLREKEESDDEDTLHPLHSLLGSEQEVCVPKEVVVLLGKLIQEVKLSSGAIRDLAGVSTQLMRKLHREDMPYVEARLQDVTGVAIITLAGVQAHMPQPTLIRNRVEKMAVALQSWLEQELDGGENLELAWKMLELPEDLSGLLKKEKKRRS